MKKPAALIIILLVLIQLMGCSKERTDDINPSAIPTSKTASEITFSAAKNPYDFPRVRTDYRLDLTSEGTAVIDRETGESTVVPYGEKMYFQGKLKYSKDTDYIIHHVRSHVEAYDSWQELVFLPVDYLRTAVYWTFDNKTPRQAIEDRFNSPHRFPDQSDKVITSYICIAEFGSTNTTWDPSFDPAWDLDGDAIIDENVGPLPDYVDLNVYNDGWKNYVARYWTNSWREELEKKIDLVAVQHFDGIMMDVMTGYWSWLKAYPSMDIGELRQQYKELIAHLSDYAKEKYGTAFLITANLDPDAYKYFGNLNEYIDGGYYQNAFFSWNGSGIIEGHGRLYQKLNFIIRKLISFDHRVCRC